nr:uncharacterized protein LOC117855843 isoform X3 [Setaria viridis]
MDGNHTRGAPCYGRSSSRREYKGSWTWLLGALNKVPLRFPHAVGCGPKLYNNNNIAFQSEASWGRLELKPNKSHKPGFRLPERPRRGRQLITHQQIFSLVHFCVRGYFQFRGKNIQHVPEIHHPNLPRHT